MTNISVKYLDKIIELPEKSSVIDLLKILKENVNSCVRILINQEAAQLSTLLKDNDEITIIHFDDPKGKHLFWHSSAHILAQAVLRLWPQAIPTIGPAIENGFYYDFDNLTLSLEDLTKIEKEAKKIIKERLPIKKHVFQSKKEALLYFKNNSYKTEIIKELPETAVITAYEQGDFFDLCRGPHVENTGYIKAFKILKTSGSYWKGNAANKALTRIYGISFPSEQQLKDYLIMLEEAKKRDHKILGTQLNLFSFHEEAPGIPFFHPKGMIIWNTLTEFCRKLHTNHGYQEIKTPLLLNKDLWIRSGHWDHYKKNMYTLKIDEKEFAIKPMNCPGCMLYYKTALRSYKELPLKISEIGHVHRYEASGALSGLMRVRGFHQDDAHIFISPSQIEEETTNVLSLISKLYGTFGLSYHLELSTRPKEGSIGSDELWELATNSLKKALITHNVSFKINEGDGAFYGPKIDIHIKDAINRTWQCGTIQLDMFLPQLFNLEYNDSQGLKQVPLVIHRALFGSIERFLGILIEHFKGRFPLWISPEQIRILNVADRHCNYAKTIKNSLEKHFITQLDLTNESISKKVRKAQLSQVNYILIIGDNEQNNNSISIRTRENRIISSISLEEFTKKALEEKDSFSLKTLL